MLAVLLLSLALPAHAEPFLDGLAAYSGKNFALAAKLFQQSADEGNDYAQVYLADLYYTGHGVTKDLSKAFSLNSAAAQQGNAYGEFGAAQQREDGDVPGLAEDLAETVRLYRLASEQGLKAAELNMDLIGLMSDDRGKLFGADYVQHDAFLAVRRLAKQSKDNPVQGLAMQALGCAYARGYGEPPDLKKATRWLKRANGPDMLNDFERVKFLNEQPDYVKNFGCQIYRANGSYLPKADKAYDWLKKDAKALRPSAVYLVGAMYEEGDGVRQSRSEALARYKKAAELGYAPAAKALARLGAGEQKPAVAAQPAETVIHSDVDEPKYKLPEKADDFALIVGVEKYKNVPPAQYAEHDAAAFKANAAALGVPERNIIYLSGEAATRSKLQAYLTEWLPKNVKTDSTLYFYYSGHGAPDVESQQAYILPWDAEPEFLKSTALPLKEVYSELGKLKAKKIVVALDSCFSGAGGRSVIAPGLRPLVTNVKPLDDAGRLVVFSAASADQASGSLDAQGHGVFTYYFLKGLQSAGTLTAKDLYFYLKPRVEDASARQNRVQTPQLAGPADDLRLR